MAQTVFPTDTSATASLVVKLWSKKLWAEALKATKLSQFIGSSASSMIQLKDETQKSAGDRVNFGLRMQLSGLGIQGDGTLKGNEESLTTFTDSLVIDQLRHAVTVRGSMSQQRVPWSIREEAKSGLVDWWKNRLDVCLLNQLAGNADASIDTRLAAFNTISRPDSGHWIFADGSTTYTQAGENTMAGTNTNTFTLKLIDTLITKAITATPAIRPLSFGGEDLYVIFIHPYQWYSLRQQTSAGQYIDIQKAAMQGGKIGDNPIFTGAVGMYNQTLIVVDARVPHGDPVSNVMGGQTELSSVVGTCTNAARAIFCGAQAATMALGRAYDTPEKVKWVEDSDDYNNQLGVSAAIIFGMKKVVFNSKDFGTIALSTFADGAH